jgi:uncharacterized repeat protein (TIGR01451 family)
LSGCFGLSQNPSYFPYLLPTGDIIRTHAKPLGHGYYTNFDPHAVRLEVRPLESTNPVRTQHVLIATIYDEKGVPRRDRRVEWMVEGVGNIVEVDESGVLPGRGYKVDNKYAVSYTDYHEHLITRGNANPNDDFVIRPGQTWCVISSAVEGDTYVTVYAPEIYNWDAHKVFVTKHWVDAQWALPPPAVNRVGTEHVVTTNLFRFTDRQPLANYRVRYRILDGPPAIFLPDRTQEIEVISRLNGNASASMVQVSPMAGVNRIGVEIIRPPDPTSPSGVGIVIGRGETTKEWRGAQLALSLTGPPAAGVNQDIPYTIAITNGGQVEAQPMTVRSVLPAGMDFVSSDPRATIESNQLIWTLGPLPGGAVHRINMVLRARALGTVTVAASVVTVEGFREEKSVATQITPPQVPQLNVEMSDAPTAVVGVPFAYQIRVTNPGTGPASNVLLSAAFDPNLQEPVAKANPLEVSLGTVMAGESRTIPLNLVALRPGRLVTRIVATANGDLRSEAQRTITAQAARLVISKIGPKARYVGQVITWDISVGNPTDVPLTNVVVHDELASELTFLSATELGQFLNGQVVWKLDRLAAGERKLLQISARCLRIGKVTNVAVVTADPNLQESAEASLDIRGLPAFALEVTKVGDPVVVGGRVTYKIGVTNTGTLRANGVEITALVPKEMKVVNTDGPSQATLMGGKVFFAKVDSLQPRQTFNYVVEAQALQVGDVRFTVELRDAAQGDVPVVKEVSTNIVPALNGNGNSNEQDGRAGQPRGEVP